MKCMKFRVRDRKHSKEIQDVLFAAGYHWYDWSGHDMLDADGLFTNDDGVITCVLNDTSFFEKHINKEYTVVDGDIHPIDDISSTRKPPSFRSRTIAESIRRKEILEAVTHYVEENEKVPQEWLDEFVELNGRTK